jgi:hypothetical protein
MRGAAGGLDDGGEVLDLAVDDQELAPAPLSPRPRRS